MSRVHVMVALGLALALTVVTLVVLRRPSGSGGGPGTAPKPLLGIDPARVIAIEVQRPSGMIEQVHRVQETGAWAFNEARSDGQATWIPSWPVDPSRVRGAVRILGALVLDEPRSQIGTGPTSVPADAPTLSVYMDGDTAVTMRLSTNVLSGRVLAEVTRAGSTPVVSWLGSDLVDVFVTSGLRPWRDEAAISSVGADVSRITLTTGAAELALARLQGHWSLLEPALGAADDEAVSRLLAALGAIRVLDFLDEGPPPGTGVESPQATVTVEWTIREARGDSVISRGLMQRLAVGRAADIGDGRRFVAIQSGEGAGGRFESTTESLPRVVEVSSAALAAIPTDPAEYVARVALKTGASDAGGLALVRAGMGESVGYRRTIDGWERASRGDSGPRATKDEEDALTGMLGVLTATRADRVELAAPAGYTPVWTVGLSGLGGIELGSAEIGGASDRAMVICSGSVWRVYSADLGEKVARWAEVLSVGGP